MRCPASSGSILSPRLQAARIVLAAAVPATVSHRGHPNPLLTAGAACWCSSRCRGLRLNYLALCKTGFHAHALMRTTADTSGKFPVPWDRAVEYAACEHRGRSSQRVALPWQWYKLPGLSSCKVWGTLIRIILMFFVGWSSVNERFS